MATTPGPEADGERASDASQAPHARSTLERVLGIVTEVRAGEGVTALLLTLNGFLLLTAYYVIKPVREGLMIAMASGAKYASYLSAVIAVALLFAVPAYAGVANRLPRNKLVVGVTTFFASHLIVFWILSRTSLESELGLVFFVWVGIFNMMVVAQFWAFANDLYAAEQGKRLFPLIGIGSTVGAAMGAYVTSLLKGIGLGTYQLLLVAALLLLGCCVLTQLAHSNEQRNPRAPKAVPEPAALHPKDKKPDPPREGAFRAVFQHKYLLLIAIFSLVFSIVNTNGEYMMKVLVRARAAEAALAEGIPGGSKAFKEFTESYGTKFYGNFFLWVNVACVILQTFVVSRIVRYGGLRIAFMIFPVIALFDSLSIALLPAILGVAEISIFRPGKIAENATDYSLNNTVRNMLWLPTTTEMKYKAKQAVDTFFVRMGDVASACIVYLGGALLHWPVRNFALVNVVLVLVWLYVARGIIVENKVMTAEKEAAEAKGEA